MEWIIAPQISDRDKVCIANVRKAHGLWDKARREWQGLLLRSKECENTQGCKFELDLEAAIIDGQKCDDENMLIESKFLGGAALSDEDIRVAASNATKLVDAIKGGNKKASAIRIWFEM